MAPFHHGDADQSGLDERSKRILDFERDWATWGGAKDEHIRDQFDLSSSRYYQLLNRVIDDDRALEYDPLLVKRLRRMRAARRRKRADRRTGADVR